MAQVQHGACRSRARAHGRHRQAGGQARPPGRWGRVSLALLGGVLVLAACSDAANWRQLQPDGWSLIAALPCKPSSMERQVGLAGQQLALRMLACSADGHTFALASADVADPTRVGAALQALSQAAAENLAATARRSQPAAVPGMTPNPAALRWWLQGRLPDGRAVAEQVLVFAHGTRVFQATLIGPQADETRAAPFFDAIRVLP